MRATVYLKLEIHKGEFHVFVLRCNPVDVETNGTEARRQYSNHAASVFDLHPERGRVGTLNTFVPVQ